MTQPPLMPQAPQVRRSWWSRNWKWVVPVGCGAVVVINLALILGTFCIVYHFIRTSTVVQMAFTTARDAKAVEEALGTPVEMDYLITGSMNYSGGSGFAAYSIPIHGPKGRATIYVNGACSLGKWRLTALVIEFAPSGRRLDLLAGNPDAARPTDPWAEMPVAPNNRQIVFGDPPPPDLGEPSPGFQKYISDLRARGLNVVIVFDSTGSMGGVITETKLHIRQYMAVVQYLVPDARIGLVTYRETKEFDPDEYEYTTKMLQFTRDVTKIESFLRKTEAYGGGRTPEEAVYEGLELCMNGHSMSWMQGSTKVIILVGDAPPHPENGGLDKVHALVKQWHKSTWAIVNCIDGGGNSGDRIMPEFRDIAEAGGGEAVLLVNEKDIIRQLAVFTFGSKWQPDVKRIHDAVLKGFLSAHIVEDK